MSGTRIVRKTSKLRVASAPTAKTFQLGSELGGAWKTRSYRCTALGKTATYKYVTRTQNTVVNQIV